MYEEFADLLKALAEPNRLKIVNLLTCKPQSANQLLAHFDVSQPTLSHHLRTLKKAGVVASHREGNSQIYCLNAHFRDRYQQYSEMMLYEQDDKEICQLIK